MEKTRRLFGPHSFFVEWQIRRYQVLHLLLNLCEKSSYIRMSFRSPVNLAIKPGTDRILHPNALNHMPATALVFRFSICRCKILRFIRVRGITRIRFLPRVSCRSPLSKNPAAHLVHRAHHHKDHTAHQRTVPRCIRRGNKLKLPVLFHLLKKLPKSSVKRCQHNRMLIFIPVFPCYFRIGYPLWIFFFLPVNLQPVHNNPPFLKMPVLCIRML